MIYLWLKAFHLIAIVCWFAGLFYLPRLFVYHTEAHDQASDCRFQTMQRKLHNIIMLPSVFAVLLTGSGLFYLNWPVYLSNRWFLLKMGLVASLIAFQARCYWHLLQFRKGQNRYSRKYFIVLNEVPSVLLISIIILVVVKPFQ